MHISITFISNINNFSQLVRPSPFPQNSYSHSYSLSLSLSLTMYIDFFAFYRLVWHLYTIDRGTSIILHNRLGCVYFFPRDSLKNKWARSLGRKDRCADRVLYPSAGVGASVCVSLALLPPSPPLPSNVSTSHFIILPVFLRVSIRYLATAIDSRSLCLESNLAWWSCLIFIPFPRFTRVSLARQWHAIDVSIEAVFLMDGSENGSTNRVLETLDQDRPVLTTWPTTLDNVKGILLSLLRDISIFT